MTKWFVYWGRGYDEGGFEEFDTLEAAEAFVCKLYESAHLQHSGLRFFTPTVVEGKKLRVTPVDVVKRIKLEKP